MTEQFWFLCGTLNLLMDLCAKATWHLPKLLFSLAGSSDLSFPNEDQLICRVVLVLLPSHTSEKTQFLFLTSIQKNYLGSWTS